MQKVPENSSTFVNRHLELWNTPLRKLLITKWLVCSGLLVQIAMCPRLWSSHRSFPTSPVFSFLGELPTGINTLILALFLFAIFAAGVFHRPRILIVIAVILDGILILLDINRLQPWNFLYLLLLCGIGIVDWEDSSNETPLLSSRICMLTIGCTYLWSGLQKMNYSFATTVFPFILRPFGAESFHQYWILAPVFEALAGVFLLFPSTRKFGVAGSIFIHFFLLIALGPFGNNFNRVIWPWNLWMPMIIFALFNQNSISIFPSIWRSAMGNAIFVLVGIMPSLSFFGRWDSYLSFALYSGKDKQGFLLFTDESASKLPSRIEQYIQKPKGRPTIDIYQWAISDLGVPPYPQSGNFLTIANKVQLLGLPPRGVTVIITNLSQPFGSNLVTSVTQI